MNLADVPAGTTIFVDANITVPLAMPSSIERRIRTLPL